MGTDDILDQEDLLVSIEEYDDGQDDVWDDGLECGCCSCCGCTCELP